MNKFSKIFFVAAMVSMVACKKSSDATPTAPADYIEEAIAIPTIGGAKVALKVNPTDSSKFNFIELSYNRNGKTRIINVSRYTDTITVPSLLNKYDYTFSVRTVNQIGSNKSYGKAIVTNSIKPIVRPVTPDVILKEIKGITADMLTGYTQSTSEGPVANLIDGDINTHWHSAYESSIAKPLPHWILIKFKTPTNLGGVRFFYRQNNQEAARATIVALESSNDGVKFKRFYSTSPGELDVKSYTIEKECISRVAGGDTALYFKVVVVANGGETFTHFGEMRFFSAFKIIVDNEAEAEKMYDML